MIDATRLEELAQAVAAGTLEPAELVTRVRAAAIVDAGCARLDGERALRCGAAEVVYGAGKTAGQIVEILRALAESGQERVLVTRLDEQKAAAVRASGVELTYRPEARIAYTGSLSEPDGDGTILVLSAGTSDAPVAEEACQTARFLGNRVKLVQDVGVAGIHRLLACGDDIARARVIIAVAGMEGALASVAAGLAACPVIAVPTSVGYGANLGGVTALLAMVSSCASGVSVVNIDNGFGAAYQASLINHLAGRGACA